MAVVLTPVIEIPSKGQGHFPIESLTYDEIAKIVLEHTADLRDGVYNRTSACPLFGGYVLSVNGEDVFFPQCCGDLSDINYWESLSMGTTTVYSGHPGPIVKIKSGLVTLDFTEDEFEPYNPVPSRQKIIVKQSDLDAAVQVAKQQLYRLTARLQEINSAYNLEIDAIDHLLVWGGQD